MKKALRTKRIWLSVGILTALSTVLGIPLLVITALKAMYLAMAFLIAIVAHGFYGVTFYFLAFASAAANVRCVSAVESGVLSYSDLAPIVGVKEELLPTRLAKCITKGYIKGYIVGGAGLEPIPTPKPSPCDVQCEFCGGIIKAGGAECPSCGAKAKI